jgi:hypothetical protein
VCPDLSNDKKIFRERVAPRTIKPSSPRALFPGLGSFP